MSKIKSKIISLVRSRRINVFLLFFVLSFIILILSKLSKTHTNTVTFNIEKVNLPEDYVIIDDSSAKLNITVKGLGFKLLPYYLRTPKIAIDFENNIYRNDTMYVWRKENGYAFLKSQIGRQIEIIDINTDSLVFKYDKNLVMMVPIQVDVDVEFSPGFDVKESYKIAPDSIKVIGPNSLVSNIEFISTEKLSLKNVKSNIIEVVNLKLPDSLTNVKFSVSKAELSAIVEKFTEGKLNVPVVVKNVPDSITLKYFPKKVSVSYYTSLSDFNLISVKDFVVECDYNNVNIEQTFLIPEIVEKPKTVKSTRISQNRVEFIIIE